MTTIDFTNQGNFTTSLFNQFGVRITGSNTLNFLNLNGFGITGGNNVAIDPGESVTYSFVDGAATGVVLTSNFASNSNGNSVFGECTVEAFDSSGLSLGTVSADLNSFSVNVSSLFGNQPISGFRIQAIEAFRSSTLTFSIPTVSITTATPTLAEAGAAGQFRISRSETSGALTVNLAIDSSSTLSPADYQLSGGSVAVSGSNLAVTIPDGVSFVDLNLAPVDDTRAETTETLKLNLAKGSYIRGTDSSASIALTDNDTARITLGMVSNSLGETGSTAIVAYSSTVAEKDIVVNLAFSGTATKGTDYTTASDTIVIPAGSLMGVLDLTAVDDAISDLAESIAIDIASITSPIATQENGVQQAIITLLDNDAPPVTPGKTATAPAPIDFSGARGLTLRGTNRANALTGTARNDILRGNGGSDRLRGLGKNDRLDGGAGNDRLEGGSGDDQLTGGDGNDTLLGGNGNDVLIGGNEADILTGGAGKDLFGFNALSEVGDQITDFSGSDDLIDLRGIFAAGSFSGSDAFARFSQFVQLVQVGSSTEVRIDADGNGAGTAFVTLATLQNVGFGAIGSQNFVIA